MRLPSGLFMVLLMSLMMGGCVTGPRSTVPKIDVTELEVRERVNRRGTIAFQIADNWELVDVGEKSPGLDVFRFRLLKFRDSDLFAHGGMGQLLNKTKCNAYSRRRLGNQSIAGSIRVLDEALTRAVMKLDPSGETSLAPVDYDREALSNVGYWREAKLTIPGTRQSLPYGNVTDIELGWVVTGMVLTFPTHVVTIDCHGSAVVADLLSGLFEKLARSWHYLESA